MNAARQRQADEAVRAKMEQQEEQAKFAQVTIQRLSIATEHAYLSAKGIRVTSNVYLKNANLVIPMHDADREIRSYQTITTTGEKRYLVGAQKLGLFHFIGPDPTSIIYLVEGYATGASVHQATRQPVCVAFDTSGLMPVAKALRVMFPDARVIVAGDNDRNTPGNPGQSKAEQAAKSIGNAAVILPLFSGEQGTDWNDLAQCEGIGAVRDQIQSAIPIEGRPRSQDFMDLGSNPPAWIIKGILPQDSLIMMFGPSDGGKSFVALDMAFCIATGKNWHGNPITQQGGVYYVCGEGDRGIGRRLQAWQVYYGRQLQRGTIFKTTSAVPLSDPGELAMVIHDIRSKPLLSIVIIDTLNRNFGGGNENSTEDMTAFINACDTIRVACGVSIAIVHHTGLTADGRARGSSVLRAALDTEIMLASHKNDPKSFNLIGSKMKDSEDVAPMSFTLKTVQVGADEDGEPFTSCVIVPCDGADSAMEVDDFKGLRDFQIEIMNTIYSLRSTMKSTRANNGDTNTDCSVTRGQIWDGYCAKYGSSKKIGKFNEAVARMVNAGKLIKRSIYYGPPSDPPPEPDHNPTEPN